MIYLDNAATTFPKPPVVMEAMRNFTEEIGANPGRSSYGLAAAASRLVFQTREQLAKLFNLPDSERIIFTRNVTEALNLVLIGLLKPGNRVLVTGLEHNAVMRPLRYLEKTIGIIVDVIPMTAAGQWSKEILAEWLASRHYQLAVLNHGSNVTGSLLNLKKIVPQLRAKNITIIVDGAQSAGAIPLNLADSDLDVFCFTGHKSLFGPQGTGGFWLRPGLKPCPLFYGGTGSHSEAEHQPDFLPDYYESGTPNTVGLAGLEAAIRFINQKSPATIHQQEIKLINQLQQELEKIPEIRIYGPSVTTTNRLPVLSFTMAHFTPAEIGYQLERQYGIMVRVGLHCAPRAHKTIGTFPQGTVRLAPGYFNTMEEMDLTITAIKKIAAAKGKNSP